MPGLQGKYSIEIYRDGSQDSGIEAIIVREDNLQVARLLFVVAAGENPDRLVMLCCQERVIARSDRL